MEQHVCVCAYECAHVYKSDKENLSNLILIFITSSLSIRRQIFILAFFSYFFLIGPHACSYLPQSIIKYKNASDIKS